MASGSTPVRKLGAPRTSGVVVLTDSPKRTRNQLAESVRRLVRGAADLSASSTELLEAATTWPEKFQVDPARANLLRGLDIPNTARVLQIGAECGAITRYLGETTELVDAVESDFASASVARERTADLPSVEVFVGTLDDIPEEKAYDLVVVVGLLETIANGSEDERPYLEFLEAVHKRLVPTGNLILATGNKLGVKYLAGASDAISQRPFASLENFPDGTSARLFTRTALGSLLGKAGFGSRTLDVFPDYSRPRAILDDDRLQGSKRELLHRIPSFPSPDFGYGRLKLLNEGLFWQELVDAGLSADFPNSFLVLAAAGSQSSEVWPENRLASFFSNNRRREYSAQTTVETDGSAVRFLRSFAANPAELISQEMATAHFVEGQSFVEVFVRSPAEARKQLLLSWSSLVQSATNSSGVALDAIPQNVVIAKDGEFELIDVEFRSTDHDEQVVIERGIFWFGYSLAEATSPSAWPKFSTVRQIVVYLGTLVGLDRAGKWLDGAVAREAELQALFTTAFTGPDAVRSWHTELLRVLERPLSSLPLGDRINDQFNASVARVETLESSLAMVQAKNSELETGLEETTHRLQAARVELDTARRDFDVARRESENQLRQARDDSDQAHRQLADIMGSRTFRAIVALRTRLDTVAPGGTHRRGLYVRSLRIAARLYRALKPKPKQVSVDPVRFSVPYSENPLVSIVIPIHGHWDYTLRCLESIARCDSGEPVEVIVVDDASKDDSRRYLESVDGVRVVALDVNVGFTRAANAGIAAARGQHVLMLNNDAEVTTGWLTALLATAEGNNVGLIGAKLVYPDGRLQEAGGIIFSDASGWNYGRFDDVSAPQYNFTRDVDYCSGAAILITRPLLDAVGGFDERYAPAYYEDTDLAFEARAHGLRVVYEPKAVVIHHEGISHGSDELVGTKRFQPINREKFLAKWADVLPAQREPSPSSVALASTRRGSKGTVIIVDHLVPLWNEDSGSVRMLRLIRTLIDLGHEVIFVPDNRYPTQPYTQELQSMGVLVWHGWSDYWQYFRDIQSEIAAVILCRLAVASVHIRNFREVLPSVPLIFDTVDLHFLREERRAQLAEDGSLDKTVLAVRELELALIRSADVTLVVSDYEKEVLSQVVPSARVFVLPNAHDSIAVSTPTSRTDITFVGSFQHPPNVDAVRWFVSDIFPRIRQRLPAARFAIVGKNPPSEVVAASPSGVDFLGWVEDLEPIHARSIVSVAPLRYGAGVKGKVGDAWAHGVPVVMTTLAAEGMSVEQGKTALIADDADAFADAVIRLYGDELLWQSISAAAREHVDKLFGAARFRQLLVEVIQAVSKADTTASP
jgi:GT2 family glycosyltransferase/2-polyprenyl-3-methyl-5-hydroxy-6-metoxy-1,4-benzoquinol methylase